MSKRRKRSTDSEENKFLALMNSIHGNAFMQARQKQLLERKQELLDPAEAEAIDDELEALETALKIDIDAIETEAEVLNELLALPSSNAVETEIATAPEPQILNPHIINALVSNRLQDIASTDQTEDSGTSLFGKRKYGKPGRPRRLDKKARPEPGGKRGRPATGKRSSSDWHGRTFYIRKRTDRIIEDALWKLKREGLELDKSELADALLEYWAEVTLGDREDCAIGDIIKQPDHP